MKINKLSRRHFFEKSLYLSAIPLGLTSVDFSAIKTEMDNEMYLPPDFQVQNVPDLERIAGLIKQKDPMIWLFTGDSITHGAKHTHGFRSYPEIFAERIRYEMGRSRDIVINTGISGNTTQPILNDFDWRIRQFKPTVVSLMIGTNDCATSKNINTGLFEQNLNSLITMIREMNSIPIMHTPNVIIREKAPERADLANYVSVIQMVATKLQVILVDNYNYWLNAIKSEGEATIFRNWLNDPLHPNGTGHSEIARLMFRVLSIFDNKAPTCGAEYYEGQH